MELRLKVKPGAASDAIGGWVDLPGGPALEVRIAAAPDKGKANKKLLAFMAKRLGVAKSALEVAAGEKSRHKTLRIHGLTPAGIRQRLEQD